MRKLLSLSGILVIVAVTPTTADAQFPDGPCEKACIDARDSEGEVIGHACIEGQEEDGALQCYAETESCAETSCNDGGVIAASDVGFPIAIMRGCYATDLQVAALWDWRTGRFPDTKGDVVAVAETLDREGRGAAGHGELVSH